MKILHSRKKKIQHEEILFQKAPLGRHSPPADNLHEKKNKKLLHEEILYLHKDIPIQKAI